MSKQDYFVPENMTRAEFDAEWKPIEARLKKILPLRDENGEAVEAHTQLLCIDLSAAADCLTGEADKTGLVERFFDAVEKKGGTMTVEQLLARPAAELSRWRKMGNRVVLLPNALVLHVNEG